MPQLRLECSDNLGAFEYEPLFKKLHKALSIITEVTSCKSVLLNRTHYYLGDGDPKRAFVYLKIGLIAGRSDTVKQSLGAECLSIIQDFFDPILEQKELLALPTVEIYDFQHYFKAEAS